VGFVPKHFMKSDIPPILDEANLTICNINKYRTHSITSRAGFGTEKNNSTAPFLQWMS
jgi:hypothetical protein